MSPSTGHRDRGRKEQEAVTPAETQQQPAVARLTAAGVSPDVAAQLAERHAADKAQQGRAKAAGWCKAISAALADAQLREAVQRVTTPAPGVGRRSLPLARAQLLAWAVQIAHRQPSLPLAEALAAALANGARPVEPINDSIPDPPGITAGAADLTARLRAFLSNPHPPRR